MRLKNKLLSTLMIGLLTSSTAFSQASDKAPLDLSVSILNLAATPSVELVVFDQNDQDQAIENINFGNINLNEAADNYRRISQEITAKVTHGGTWEVRIYSDDEYSLELPSVTVGNQESEDAYETAIANNLFLKAGDPVEGNEANVMLKFLLNQTVVNVGTENETTFDGPRYDDPATVGVTEEIIPDYTNDSHWAESEIFISVFDVTTTGFDNETSTYEPFYRTLTSESATTEGNTNITFQLVIDAENTPTSDAVVSYGRDITVELYIE